MLHIGYWLVAGGDGCDSFIMIHKEKGCAKSYESTRHELNYDFGQFYEIVNSKNSNSEGNTALVGMLSTFIVRNYI